jgi:hypothetical protein
MLLKELPQTADWTPNHPMHAMAKMRLIKNWAPLFPKAFSAKETVGRPVSHPCMPIKLMKAQTIAYPMIIRKIMGPSVKPELSKPPTIKHGTQTMVPVHTAARLIQLCLLLSST